MSSRPKRVRQEPERLQQNNWMETETRKKAKTPAGNQKNQKKQKPKIRSNIKSNPRTKILNTIATLRNEKAPTNGLNRTGYVFLSSLYRDHPSSQLLKYLEIPNNELREFIYKQHQTITKRSSLLHTQSDSVTINMNDDKMHDLLIMLWMDMSHDDLLKNILI